jgi:hypothetical protein
MKNEKIWGNSKLDYENYMTSPWCRFVNSSYGKFSSYILRWQIKADALHATSVAGLVWLQLIIGWIDNVPPNSA